MAYEGSPDFKDFELARTLRVSSQVDADNPITKQEYSSPAAKAKAALALAELNDARESLDQASRRMTAAEVAARESINLLPKEDRQTYFDEINAASGILPLADTVIETVAIDDPYSDLLYID